MRVGLEQLAQHEADVVLLDLRLPDSEGLATLQQARAAASGVPVIVLTGQGDDALALRAVQEGAQDYLVKGRISREALVRVIRHAVERGRLERALRASEERFRHLADHARDLVFRYELHPVRGFSYVSPSATQIVGYSPDEHYANPDLGDTIIHPDDRSQLERIAAGQVLGQPLALRWLHKDGHIVWTELHFVPIHDADGQLLALEGSARDITRRKQAEAAREELLVREQAARSEAEAAIVLRDRVLATVSHDLKNSVTGIKAMAQVLALRRVENRSDGKTLAEGLALIDEAATRMDAQIDELVDMAQRQMGHPLALQRGPTDLAALAREVVAHFQATTTHLLRVTGDDGVIGHWDAPRLRRVLDNLISNAVKYSPPEGEVSVEVTREGTASRAWALVRVQDRGIGIPASDLPRIFDPFYRAANVGQVKGSGIGLDGARHLVTLHGGTIAVESAEGNGTCFFVRLPIDAPDPGGDGSSGLPQHLIPTAERFNLGGPSTPQGV
jgi:PAS domain S-box-containing protein